MRHTLKTLVSEPLVQFALIGLVIFGLDRLTREEAEDPKTIRVDTQEYTRLARIFVDSRGRLPSQEEMDALVKRFLDNEVLYREARTLELDHGDEMMRERMMQSMRLIIYNSVSVGDPSEEDLRSFFEERRAQYSKPVTLTFRIIGLDGTEEDAAKVASDVAERQSRREVLNRSDFPMATFRARPVPQLEEIFDAEFIAEVGALEIGAWTPVPSYRGWQVVQLIAKTEAIEPDFDAMRGRIATDWEAHTLQRQARAALEALKDTYPVERRPYAPEEYTALLEAAPADDLGTGAEAVTR